MLAHEGWERRTRLAKDPVTRQLALRIMHIPAGFGASSRQHGVGRLQKCCLQDAQCSCLEVTLQMLENNCQGHLGYAGIGESVQGRAKPRENTQ